MDLRLLRKPHACLSLENKRRSAVEVDSWQAEAFQVVKVNISVNTSEFSRFSLIYATGLTE